MKNYNISFLLNKKIGAQGGYLCPMGEVKNDA